MPRDASLAEIFCKRVFRPLVARQGAQGNAHTRGQAIKRHRNDNKRHKNWHHASGNPLCDGGNRLFLKGVWMFSSFRGAVLALVIVPSAGTSQDFDAGMAAAEACDFTTALREWTPLAEQGDVDAQHNFGHMCVQGFGVPQDDAKAVKWFRLAAEQGNADGQTNLLDDLLGSPEPFRGTRRRLSAGLDCRPNLRRRRGLLVKMDQHIRTPLRLAG